MWLAGWDLPEGLWGSVPWTLLWKERRLGQGLNQGQGKMQYWVQMPALGPSSVTLGK